MSEVKYLLSLQKWGLMSDGHLLNALPLQFNNFPFKVAIIGGLDI